MFRRKELVINIILLSLLSVSCNTVEKYNTQINTLKSVKDLKSDVNYIQNKLEKLHPDLYHYITKKELDRKFDSLRSSITVPLTSNDFYFRISPIVASIRQGHTRIYPLTKKLKSSETQLIGKRGTSALVQFDYEMYDKKLYIVKNYSKDSTILPGTEVLSVNGLMPDSIINKYKSTFSSDGYNETFVNSRLASAFPRYFYYEYGIMDSVCCQLKYKDSIRIVTFKRLMRTKPSTIKKSKEQIAKEKKSQQEETKKRKLLGYDLIKHMYSKQLTFPTKDSSVAIIKITDFMKGNYKKFYKKSFEQLDSLHTKNLIIDLRDNGGGRLAEIQYLYSYLADSSFRFMNKYEVTSKTSLWHTAVFNDKPLWKQALLLFAIPDIIIFDSYTFIMTTKGNDNKYRFALSGTRLKRPKLKRFKGNVYVLINGGSFSASSLLSSNLQGSKRAMFVGQETGGANNGCVAGIMPTFTLPKSKLTVIFGLLVCETPFKTQVDGRGIFPNVEINPTLKDRLNDIDPELQWILEQNVYRK